MVSVKAEFIISQVIVINNLRNQRANYLGWDFNA